MPPLVAGLVAGLVTFIAFFLVFALIGGGNLGTYEFIVVVLIAAFVGTIVRAGRRG